jgi:natural product precursor
MKKLEKLTLKQMNLEIQKLDDLETKSLKGGGDGYCVFVAMGQIGQMLGCGPSSANEAAAGYSATYGTDALIQSTAGISPSQTYDFLDVYFNVSSMSPNNYTASPSQSQTMGILNLGSGNYHAVVMTGTCGSQYLYMDNDGTLKAADPSQFFTMYNVRCE